MERKTVAVITVHGVGDQKPFETARAIGDLLQDLDIGARPPDQPKPPPCAVEPKPAMPVYFPFREQPLRINVRPVVVTPEREWTTKPGMRGPFHAWVDEQLKLGRRVESADELPIEFMRGQLRCYHGESPEDTYETIRLEGRRAGDEETDVHIYEVYWADLSRLKAGLLSIFTELYQLLFHLSSLGTHTVNAAAMQHQSSAWKRLRSVQSWASVALSVPIPLVNLFMLGVTAVVVGLYSLQRLPWVGEAAVVGALLATPVAFGLGKWLWSKESGRGLWMAPVVLCLAIVGGAVWWAQVHVCRCDVISAGESGILALIVTGALAVVIRIYNRRRPEASRWALWMGPMLLVAGAASYAWRGGGTTVTFWLREFEVFVGALLVAWAAFFIFGFAAWALGQRAVADVAAGVRRDLARRSRWTGRVLLALPAFLFATITLVGWGLIGFGAKQILREARLAKFIDKMLEGPVEQALAIVLALAGIAVLPAIWSLAPVVWREVFPPDAYDALRGGSSAPLGRWLNRASFGLLASGVILYVAMMFVMPVGTVLFAARIELLKNAHWLHALGGLSGVAFAWLFAMRGGLRKLALGFRPVVDILLDVDNWLREHPLDSNPKARICGRYVSLLRYVLNWKSDDAPAGYDKIVILAHSQGTVISADLLRFIHAEARGGSTGVYDPQLARLDEVPITMFTMGCPLRQLYGQRFPYLYHWARHDDKPPMDAWVANDIPDLQRPDPGKLGGVHGLALWDNAYRSGDYIGRNLWRTDPCRYIWDGDVSGSPQHAPVQNNSTDGARRLEFCIGAGAHTHYWDETAPMIALELDRLIR